MRALVFISRDSGALCVGAEEVARALFRPRRAWLDVEIVRTGSRGMYRLDRRSRLRGLKAVSAIEP